jgi:quercetin dioxygenase-like cupin family protein
MARVDDVLEDPATGIRVVFRRTARETNGRAVVVEMFVAPSGRAPGTHLHPNQEERIDVLHGSVGFRLGRDLKVVGPGRRVTVPRGTRHAFWNAGDEVAHLVCELRPALRFESLIEALLAAPADGKGNLLRRAIVAHEHFDTVRMPFPPGPIQRFGLAVGAGAGRLLGL